MITRLVKMTFRNDQIDSFIEIFIARKQTILSFPGCHHVELWQEINNRNVFFTYSIWENEKDLDHYRYSEFFKETWSITKSKFSEKASAWSLSNPLGNKLSPGKNPINPLD